MRSTSLPSCFQIVLEFTSQTCSQFIYVYYYISCFFPFPFVVSVYMNYERVPFFFCLKKKTKGRNVVETTDTVKGWEEQQKRFGFNFAY